MRSWMMPGLLAVMLGWILAPGLAHAVALGKVEVTSHLGEAFYAEVPLRLEKDEKLANVTVEIAGGDDYRILEVYRDPALNAIRTSVEDDSRGIRVKLVSDSAIESPFFNLVLKVHYGNATSFKKYPVFLDLPSAVVSTAKPKPAVKPVTKPAAKAPAAEAAPVAAAMTEPQPQAAAEEKAPAPAAKGAEAGAAPFKPFSGWARIDRYGPMVYGDTIMTVARRLRVDERYTIKQVMVAVFDKNRDKFDKENMNLIKAGAYLKVPTAKEVEAITPRRARQVVAEQDKQWKALRQEPRYAAVEKAQQERYSGKVRIGESAEGVPAGAGSPARMEGEKGVQLPAEAPVEGKQESKAEAPSTAAVKPEAGEVTTAQPSPDAAALQQQNEELQKKLQQADEKITALNAKLASPDVAASDARIKKLELKLARMQTQLDAARQQAAMAAKNSFNELLVYGLGGLAVVLLAAIGYLLRRERPHPAAQAQPEETSFEDDFSTHSSVGMFESEVEEEITPQAEAVEETAEPEEAAFSEETASDEEVEPVVEEESGEETPRRELASDEVDPNVDYVAESDVYLRYGMEDEALRQLNMAIRQRGDNADAHCKLVRLLRTRGDEDALAAAIEAGRSALSDDELARFESEVAGEVTAEAPAEAVDFGQQESEAFPASGEEPGIGGLDLEGLEVPADEESGIGGIDLEEMEIPAAEESEEAAEVDLSSAGEDVEGLDVGELEWSFGGEDEGQEEPVEEGGEEASPEASDEVPESAEAELDDGDFDALVESGLSMDEADETESGADEEGAEESQPADIDADDAIALDLPDLEGEAEDELAPVSEEEADAGDDIALNLPDLEGEAEEEASASDVEDEVAPVVEEDTDVSETQEAGADEAVDAIDLDLSSLMIDEDEIETAPQPEQASSDEGEEEQGDYDVTQELDDLLDELGVDADMEVPHDDGVTADSLAIDIARSQVAQGALEEADAAFQSALDGDFRCQGLLGMAEVAQQRGDSEKAAELLAEAEGLLDDGTREWFGTLKEKQGE